MEHPVPVFNHKKEYLKWIYYSAVFIGIILLVIVSLVYPFTNDEGAYLYDARVLLEGRIPTGDVLVKSPVVMVLFSLGEYLTHYSLFAARAVNLLASLLIAFLLWDVVRRISNRQQAYRGVILWLFASGSIVFFSFGHTEPLAALFSLAAVDMWIIAIRDKTALKWAFLSGLFFICAFASRKSALSILPVVIVAWYILSPGFNKKIIVYWIGGASLASVLWLVIIYDMYSWVGVREAVGIGYAQLSIGRVAGDPTITAWGGGIQRIRTVILRVAAPLVIMLLYSVAASISSVYMRRIMWTFATVVSIWALLWSADRNYILVALIWLGAALIFIAQVLWPQKSNVPRGSSIPIIWILSLTALYATWPTLLPEYVGDFLVPITLWAGFTIPVKKPFIIVLLAVGGIITTYSAIHQPWTGMFSAKAIYQSAEYLQKNVPLDESIFTAAVIIPYVSGHRVAGDLSHPYWYSYAFIPQDTRRTFLPSPDNVQNLLKNNVQWILNEHLTAYVYSQPSFAILNLPIPSWKLCETISNETIFRSNLLTLWHRGECLEK